MLGFGAPVRRIGALLSRFAHAWWYAPLVALLSAADAFIFIVPNEVLLAPAVLAYPKHWLRTAFFITLGSAAGAALFAGFTTRYGIEFVNGIFPHLTHESGWEHASRVIYAHGMIGLALISLSPFPQHAAVAIAGLVGLSPVLVFASVFMGRMVKYGFLSWAVVHAPSLLRKLGLLKKDFS